MPKGYSALLLQGQIGLDKNYRYIFKMNKKNRPRFSWSYSISLV
jgi:hypothetical protein